MRRFLLLLLLGGCAHGGGPPESLRGLPAHTDPPIDLADDDDLTRARAAYDALRLDDPGRSAKRRELWQAYQMRIEGARGEGREQAFRHFRNALQMWDAQELADPTKVPPDLESTSGTAEGVYRQFSTSGSDLESATALAVLAAAHPERAADWEKTWNDIVAYTNDLAVAEAGPGAERSRAIVILQEVTASFPSRWAGDKLVALYLARQEIVNRAIQSGSKDEVTGAYRDTGVQRPVWNLIRIHARLGRFDDGADAADKLDKQFGDETELRKRLRTALTSSDGQTWLAVMAAYLPSGGGRAGDGDPGTAYAFCAEGARRLPQAVDPRKCLAELARITDRIPLARRWIDEARALAPDDHDVGEITARLQLIQLGDAISAERLDEARAQLRAAQAFHADAAQRWKDKPLQTSLADIHWIFGRGLYNLGEIDEARVHLEIARRLEPAPRAVEELATIDFKTGHPAEAAAGYEKAAATPRDTPLESTLQGARLRRLQAEALLAAGDRPGAEKLWKRCVDEWRDVLRASISPGRRAEAYVELGKVLFQLGDREKSLQAFNAAVDTDPEQMGVYGDVISFLATRGLYGPAIDAYHRALGRAEVTDYLKVYSSLWLYDLARLQGRAADPLLVEYLKGVVVKEGGARWFHHLAKFKLGELGWEGLLAKADTRGKRAEAYFYRAMDRYVAQDRAEAERLLGEVKATRMLGFFEYDMASWYLKNGPPGVKP